MLRDEIFWVDRKGYTGGMDRKGYTGGRQRLKQQLKIMYLYKLGGKH
jgi:hypothetical protein